MLILKAEPAAAGLYTRIARVSEAFRAKTGRAPTLATVLVGEDAASAVYVRKKGEMCRKLGLGHRDHKLATDSKQDAIFDVVRKLNADDQVDGILVQSPLPNGLDESPVFDLIDPAKDVDCFSPHNVGLLLQGRGHLHPCTPAGVMRMLKHYGLTVAGKRALVVGRSNIVGKPMAALLLHANATVTVAHSKTRNIAECVAESEIVVAAIGRPKFLRGELPWRPDAVVIDVGINRQPDGKLCGDVDYDAVAPKVAAITPVPGGVGPMTIALLMENTARAACARAGVDWRQELESHG